MTPITPIIQSSVNIHFDCAFETYKPSAALIQRQSVVQLTAGHLLELIQNIFKGNIAESQMTDSNWDLAKIDTLMTKRIKQIDSKLSNIFYSLFYFFFYSIGKEKLYNEQKNLEKLVTYVHLLQGKEEEEDDCTCTLQTCPQLTSIFLNRVSELPITIRDQEPEAQTKAIKNTFVHSINQLQKTTQPLISLISTVSNSTNLVKPIPTRTANTINQASIPAPDLKPVLPISQNLNSSFKSVSNAKPDEDIGIPAAPVAPEISSMPASMPQRSISQTPSITIGEDSTIGGKRPILKESKDSKSTSGVNFSAASVAQTNLPSKALALESSMEGLAKSPIIMNEAFNSLTKKNQKLMQHDNHDVAEDEWK